MIQIDYSKKYVLAVSGGKDSMCMLHMFANLTPRPDFWVVTVNHSIRDVAANDVAVVQNFCNQLGVHCLTETVDAVAYSKEHKVSVETAARILRYAVLDQQPCDFVCLAHHKGDNAETILMHILRGSGASGAEGIRQQNGKYLRPILDMTREQISSYVSTNCIPFVEDSTNFDTSYVRNHIRNNVMPVVNQAYPDAESALVRFACNIASDNDYLNSLADVSSVCFDENGAVVPLELLRAAKPIAVRVLQKTFAQLGIFADIETTHIDSLLALANSNGGKRISLPFGLVAYNDYTHLTLKRTANSTLTDVSGTDFCVPFVVGTTVTPHGKLVVSREPTVGALRVDMLSVPTNAVVRFRREGDVFQKFGGGTKPLCKYLIDKKVPQRNRDKLPLIAVDNNVLVVCGVEISDIVKTSDNSDVVYVNFYMEE